jgi:hypothetical protein
MTVLVECRHCQTEFEVDRLEIGDHRRKHRPTIPSVVRQAGHAHGGNTTLGVGDS